MNRRHALTMLGAATLAACGGGFSDVEFAPTPHRAGIHYGYYMSVPGQMAATGDHTDLFWHAQFYPTYTLAAEIAGTSQAVVLDCANQLFPNTGRDRRLLSPTAEPDLRAYFAELRTHGVLGRVKYLTPMDEPNLFCANEPALRAGLEILKRVASEFYELDGVRYVCIYGTNALDLWCLDQFDIVGVDNYAEKSEVLTIGAHAELMKQLLPGQQVMILPGAAYGQDPQPFVDYAHATPQVWGVIPFTWCHVPASADKEGWVGLSLRSAEDQERYRQAGFDTLDVSTRGMAYAYATSPKLE